MYFFFSVYGNHRARLVLKHAFPTRRVTELEHCNRTQKVEDQCNRRQTQDQQGAGDFERPGEIGPGMVRQSLTKRGIAVVHDICPHRGMTATDLESRKAGATAEEAGKRRCQAAQGERRIQEKDRDRKSTRLHSSHSCAYRMPSSARKK